MRLPPTRVALLLVAGSGIATPPGATAVAPTRPLTAPPAEPVRVPVAAPVPRDTVVVLFGADAVTIRQRIPARDDAIEAHAIALDGQTLRIDRATRAGHPLDAPALDRLPGAYRLRIDGREPLDIQYRVTGRRDRIPLFVPSPEAQLASAPVTLRVELTPEASRGLDLGTSLPRFRRASEGTLIATLSSTPTFVRLDAAGGLSFARAADLAVVLLIVLAAVWAWRAARRSDVLAGRGERLSTGQRDV